MSHAATVLASRLDWLQHPCIVSTDHSTIYHFTLLSWHLLPTPLLHYSNPATWYSIIKVAISYTTLSKLHLAGNIFQCLSTPHGVAGGLASIKRSTAKIGERNVENGCSWWLYFYSHCYVSLTLLHFHKNGFMMLHLSTGVHTYWENEDVYFNINTSVLSSPSVNVAVQHNTERG